MSVATERRGAAHRGPPLSLLAAVHIALFLGSIVVLMALTEGNWPLPGASTSEIATFFEGNSRLLRVAGMLQFGAAVPLLLYAAGVSSQLRHIGVRAAGTVIALAGGTSAAVLLGLSGLGMVTAGATATEATAGALAVLHGLVFEVGGAGTVVFTGLLLAGIAVTTLLAGLLPRWLCWATLAVAVACELATLALAVDPLNVLIPVGRFGAMAVLLAVGVLLPTRRPAASRAVERTG